MSDMERRLVRWTDSNGGHGWSALTWFLENAKPSQCESIGFVLHEDDEYIVLIQSLDYAGGDVPPGDVRHGDGFIAIPKAVITEQFDVTVWPRSG